MRYFLKTLNETIPLTYTVSLGILWFIVIQSISRKTILWLTTYTTNTNISQILAGSRLIVQPFNAQDRTHESNSACDFTFDVGTGCCCDFPDRVLVHIDHTTSKLKQFPVRTRGIWRWVCHYQQQSGHWGIPDIPSRGYRFRLRWNCSWERREESHWFLWPNRKGNDAIAWDII